MNIKILIPLIAIGILAQTGCTTPSQLPDKTKIQALDLQGAKLPIQWVKLLGKNVNKTPEISTLDAYRPFDVIIPEGFGAIGSSFDSIVCVSPQSSSIRFFIKDNLKGAKLNFWRNVIYRTLQEEHGY